MSKIINNLLILILLFGGQFIYAQAIEISGTVTDGSGVPIPGVNIFVEGTSIGTSTDFDGNYSISAESGQVLSFSSVGFQDIQQTVGSNTVINVTMEEGTSLDEVVVTALGISREKKSLGYATQEVSGEDLARANQSSVASSLSGKVAGVQIRTSSNIGGSVNVIIRGNKSLTGNNQALWVIDGVPVDNTNYSTSNDAEDYGNPISDLNPEDIASMNILKGAAATALYGSRAANGAIIVTTKDGKKQKGLGVTINSGVNFGSMDMSTFPKFQNEYGAGYGQVNGPNNDEYFYREDIDGDGVLDYVMPYNQYGGWGAPFDANLMVYQFDSYYPESPTYKVPRPWVMPNNGPKDLFNKNPLTLTNSVSLAGSSEKSNFRIGYTKYIHEGLVPKNKMIRDNVSLNSSYNITDELTVSGAASYTTTTVEGRVEKGRGAAYSNVMVNLRQFWQPGVDYKRLKDLYDSTGKDLTQFPTGTIDNPYYLFNENKQSDTRNRFIGNASISYKITDWLDVVGKVSIDTYNYEMEEKQNTLNRIPAQYKVRNNFFKELNYDLMLNYNKDFGDDFNVSGTIGTNIRRNEFRSIQNETNGGLVVKDLYAISNSLGTPPPATERFEKLGVNGVFGLVSLGYKDFLFMDITGRNDWSSTLPSGSNSFFYPSVSSSFLFSELLNSQSLSFGKLSLNYAEVGNSAPVHSLMDNLSKPVPFGSTQLFSVNSTKNNQALKPERTKSWELGLEASFFNRRLGIDFAAYKTNTENQIMPVRITPATGYLQRFVNAGEVENKGLELSLNGTPVKSDDFKWDITVNWSINKSKIVSLYPGVQNLELLSGGDTNVSINALLGEPYGVFFGYDHVYKDGKKVVNQETGYYERTATADHVIGQMMPDWVGGINNSISYKNIALSFLVDVQKGGKVFSADMARGTRNGLYSNTTGSNELGNPVRNPVEEGGGLILEGVTPDGAPNTMRSSFTSRDMAFSDQIAPSSMFLYDASYVKLREAAISYAFPTALIEKIKLSNLEVSLVGSNLWIIHKNLPHADPEAGLVSGNVSGFQMGAYPTMREIGFNVKLQF